MNTDSNRALLACILVLAATTALAEQGVDRAVGGATETITSPARIFDGIQEETDQHGAIGVVTGSLKGGANAAGQAVKGAANIGVGVLEAMTSPLRK
ncbi:MAG: hypothetical protein WD928_15495 [Gammaproteobacteria bacterium]